jgi:hypothetical protein
LPITGGYIAEVHSGDRRDRQSFSLCHELGHTLFDNGSTGSSKCDLSGSGSENKLEERLCDSIASELLMPKDVFTKEVQDREASWNELCKIARTFQVSKEAAINRIRDLDIWHCILIMLHRTVTDTGHEKFELKGYEPSRSLALNVVGTGFLVYTVVEYLNSGGGQAFRMKNSYQASLGLSTPLLLSGHYFEAEGGRFARLLVTISQSRLRQGSDSCMSRSKQLSFYEN